MRKSPGVGSRFLRYLGGLLLGLILVGGAVSVLSLRNPLPDASVSEPSGPVGGGDEIAAVTDGEPVAVISPEVAPSDPAVPAPVPQPSAEVNASLRGSPEPSQPAEDGRFSVPEPFETPATDDQFSGLPPAATLEGPAPVGEAPAVENPAFALQGPALELNAEAFERRGNLPLIAVILSDAGESELSAETLLSLSMPLTLGIAPRDDAAIELAAEAKLAGYEVLAQLPVGSAPADLISPEMSDLEVSERVDELMASLYMAVGATGLVADGAALDDRIIKGVIPVLERNGFAFVNADAASLEAGRAFAGAFGVAYAGQSQRIPADATAEMAYAALEAAAAEASAGTGAVILSGPASRAMLEGLLRWGLEKGGRSGQLAPVSAVINAVN